MFKRKQKTEQRWKKALNLNKTISYITNKIDKVITYFIKVVIFRK